MLIYGGYEEIDEFGHFLTCQGSFLQSIIAFLDSESFEDAIKKAIQYGCDTDTQACMAGSIAEAYYGIPYKLEDKVLDFIPIDLIGIYYLFKKIKLERKGI